jgi:hypothetical protein
MPRTHLFFVHVHLYLTNQEEAKVVEVIIKDLDFFVVEVLEVVVSEIIRQGGGATTGNNIAMAASTARINFVRLKTPSPFDKSGVISPATLANT